MHQTQHIIYNKSSSKSSILFSVYRNSVVRENDSIHKETSIHSMNPLKFPIICILASAIWLLVSSTIVVAEYVGGSPHEAPVDLDDDSFAGAISDSANQIWFLKFYAPWCGHW
ncbi:MAG: hypothetical protein ACI8RD_004963 [Bacillariaceae sp.]|jgi:hypothetical protein